MRNLNLPLLLLALLSVAPAASGFHRDKLHEYSMETIRGRALQTLIHEKRPLAFSGKYLIKDETEGAIAAGLLNLTSPSDVAKFKPIRTKLNGVEVDPSILVDIPDLIDPIQGIALELHQGLVNTYGMTAFGDPSTNPLLPPASDRKGYVLKSYLPEIIQNSQGENIILDVQTLAWSVTRPTLVQGTWFSYLARMTLLDARTGKVLSLWDCRSVQRLGSMEKIPLPIYLKNDLEMLRGDLTAATQVCRREFSSALGLTPRQ